MRIDFVYRVTCKQQKKTTKNESYYLRGKIVALVNLLHYHRGQEGEDEIMSGFI